MAKSSGNSTGGCVFLLALGIGWLFVNHGCGSSSDPEAEAREKAATAQEEKRLTPGYVGRFIASGNASMIPLGKTSADYEEVSKSLNAKDDVGFGNLILENRAFSVKSGTQAKMLDYERGKIRVRIMDGEHKDEDGWTADEFFR